ncbi:MAG: FKBP-type peptidyl-prolyl cis-trans isomerase [Burkholderiaceae bacterium]
MKIEADVWVTLRYRLHDAQGEPIEEDDRDWTYLHGHEDSVFPKITSALEGRSLGETLSLYLEPEDTFGDYDADLLRLVPRDRFPDTLEEGMAFETVPGESPDGLIYTVTDLTDEVVVLDGNHPLAGMALRFELVIEDLRYATPEEIADAQARLNEAQQPPGS